MTIKIAVISDLHYSLAPLARIPHRKGEHAAAFLLQAVKRLNSSIKPDITAILGDMINEPDDAQGTQKLKTLKVLSKLNEASK